MENLPFGMELGRWYELAGDLQRSGAGPVVVIARDAGEVRVPVRDLLLRQTKPDYAFAYQVEQMGPSEERRLMQWMPVCPDGHRGNSVSNAPPDQFTCAKCQRSYSVQTDDSALVMIETGEA